MAAAGALEAGVLVTLAKGKLWEAEEEERRLMLLRDGDAGLRFSNINSTQERCKPMDLDMHHCPSTHKFFELANVSPTYPSSNKHIHHNTPHQFALRHTTAQCIISKQSVAH